MFRRSSVQRLANDATQVRSTCTSAAGLHCCVGSAGVVEYIAVRGGCGSIAIAVVMCRMIVVLLQESLVVLGRNNPSLYTVKGRPLYVHVNGLAIVLLK